MKTKPILTLTVLAALLVVPFAACAEATWTLSAAGCTSDCPTANLTGANTTVTGKAEAFSTASTSIPKNLQAARLYQYGSGNWGVVANGEDSNDTGPHAMDNNSGTDLIELAFSQKVELSKVTIGWNGTDDGGVYPDSDISILAYTRDDIGPGNFKDLTGNTFGTTIRVTDLLSNGWSLVGNYADVGAPNDNSKAINSSQTASSWWLISAFNAGFSRLDNSGLNWDTTKDSMKLISVAGNVRSTTKTPEPAGLALVGLGLLGLMASRRRITK